MIYAEKKTKRVKFKFWVSWFQLLADPTVLWNPWQVPFPQRSVLLWANRPQLNQAKSVSLFRPLESRFPVVRVQRDKLVVIGEKPIATPGKVLVRVLKGVVNGAAFQNLSGRNQREIVRRRLIPYHRSLIRSQLWLQWGKVKLIRFAIACMLQCQGGR